MKRIVLFLWLILAVGVNSSFLFAEQELRKFEHFFLRQFTIDKSLSKDIFKDSPFYKLDTFPDDRILRNTRHKSPSGEYSFENEQERLFYTSNPIEFPEIDLSRKYYYDSLARGVDRISVYLFGTLWLPETQVALDTLKQLYENYSKTTMNERVLAGQFQKWFKSKTKTKQTYTSLNHLIKKDRQYLANQKQYENELKNLYASNHGARYFWPFPFTSLFFYSYDIYKVISTVPFKSDVIFAFVVTSGQSADAQAFLKDENVPFPVLDDYSADVSERFIEARVPVVVLVDSKGRVIYQGDCLVYQEMKSKIDRVLLDVYQQEADKWKQKYHMKLYKVWKEEVERKLREQRTKEAEARRKARKAREAKGR